ncbi:MAG: hypothetical protein JW828_15000 [Sedimentisphaerales bacterium]|nr:hypothetical protein [Sedimentisphaerales bacterium]
MVTKICMGALLGMGMVMSLSCTQGAKFTGAKNEVKIMTLDPGHFHAALVQKIMYPQVSPTVHVYAPKGSDVQDHLNRIDGFNTRQDNPTSWEEVVYTGPDFLDRMISDRPGNVVVISGNNRQKTEYIKACADAGFQQLVDKPMCIDRAGFALLLKAFDSAEENGVLLYDIMTERSEITTILQKELMHIPSVFGELKKGTPQEPAVEKESVHHFFKTVAGNPIKRPGWYFDTNQQGEGIVDVTTHLVDLVAWECFPEVPLDYAKDLQVLSGRRWPTVLTRQEYQQVTRLDDFIESLKPQLDQNGALPCYANGQIDYTIKGVHARIKVLWNYQTPEGGGDTHYSIMRGTRSNIIIRQGKEENYRPELFVEPLSEFIIPVAVALPKAFLDLEKKYPGIKLNRKGTGWHISIPDQYRVGHEAHFGQVTERFLQYLIDGTLPDWEVPNMKAKYYVTTTALEMAKEAK